MTATIPAYTTTERIRVTYKDVTAVPGYTEDLTRYLNSLPTIKVGGSSATNSLTVSMTGVQCLNFVGGARSLILQSATLQQQFAAYIFANTGGTFPVSLMLRIPMKIISVPS